MADKHDKVYQILAGTIGLPAPADPHSVLLAIQTENQPGLKPNLVSFVAVPLAFMLVAVLMFAYEQVVGPLLSPGLASMLVLLLVVLWLGVCLGVHRRQLAGVSERYLLALQELKATRDYLDSYLTGLDERTSRYFHCVTSTKVLNYCVLRQINAALGERVDEIARLLRSLDPAAILDARRLLVGMLFFYDGALANTGSAHLLPMARVQVSVRLLVENLEAGVAELEDEIVAARKLYETPAEPEEE